MESEAQQFWPLYQSGTIRLIHAHLDYIRWNPVKHGLVRNVADWEDSSLHSFVERGLYPANRGGRGVDLNHVAGERRE